MKEMPLCPFCNLSRAVPSVGASATEPPEPGVTWCLLLDEYIPEGQEPFVCDHFIERREVTMPARDWCYVDAWNTFQAIGRIEN
ncbi:MAG: hypothetical protein ABIG63_21630 [Chloroflexota bacterium]